MAAEKYYLDHTGAQLDVAIDRVLSGWVSPSENEATYNKGYNAGLKDATPTLQAKTVTPNTIQQIVLPDSEYKGLSQVIVEAIPQSYIDEIYNQGYDAGYDVGYKDGYGDQLPYKTTLPYIQSSGTQYIDTGFKPNNNTRVVMDAQFVGATSVSTLYTPFGVRGGGYFFELYKAGSNNWNLTFLWGTKYPNYFTIDWATRHTFEINKNVATIDGVSKTNTAETFQLAYNLFLCADNNANTATAKSPLKIYSCQIYDDGTLIRNYIPVLDLNNVPCLYDKVIGTFAYNSGTGSFSY